MSSMRSPVAPTEHRTALGAALITVGEQSFCGYVNLEAGPEFAAAVAAVPAWMAAAVAFRGPVSAGRLLLALPVPLAEDLLGAFLGLAEPGAAPELADMVGEFANMLCGCWLTQNYPTTSFALTKPIVHGAAGAPAFSWAAAPAPLLALLNDQPIAIWVECPPEDCT